MTEAELKLLLAEYDTLKNEIRELVKDSRTVETGVAGAVAALLAWLTSARIPLGLVWYLPIALTLLGALRSWAIRERLTALSTYIRSVEARFLAAGFIGWEETFRTSPSSPLKKVSFAATIFWMALILISGLAPSWLSSRPAQQSDGSVNIQVR